ncbi:MAG: tRNA 2-thiouridine(34) synthase MnmA, partial [Oscillospiraceae bacterium]|nr:tRNA 2-thiouridine(34) synthase MnmA [Oscillospiraceae bacterium]
MERNKKRVLVAMSGGVDSSVAAYLLQEQGYECVGVTMKLFGNEAVGLDKGHPCCTLDDVEDAREVARRMGIPHYVFNFSDEFEEKVIQPFVDAYERGETPNPCIDCNRFLKFDKLHRRAQELGCEYIATGHYAQIVDDGAGGFCMTKAADLSRDQSYVLYPIPREQLGHTLFPLGGLTKGEVRQIAEREGFVNARKHDSQDICFVPDGDYLAFMERYTGKTYPAGDIIDQAGKVVGRHRGAAGLT